MKIAYFFVLLTVFAVTSCKQEPDPPPPHQASFKLDGSSQTLTTLLAQIRPNAGVAGQKDLTYTAVSLDSKKVFSFVLQKQGDFTPGDYATGTAGLSITVDYLTNPGAPNERDYTLDFVPARGTPQFSIKITKISATEITGTFSGNYLYDRTNDAFVTLTDGSFSAKLR